MPSRRRDVQLLIAALAVLAVTAVGFSHPKPATVPYRWELDFRPGPVRLYVDPVDGSAYWYFTYTVINRTGQDRIWAPSFVLYTDSGAILESGQGVPPRLEESLRDLLGNELLETQNEVIGDLLQGPEYAKDGLVVWPADDLTVNELTLFIGGISGETARVTNPLTEEESILRKTLQRDYLIRGSALARGSRPLELAEERWVLR